VRFGRVGGLGILEEVRMSDGDSGLAFEIEREAVERRRTDLYRFVFVAFFSLLFSGGRCWGRSERRDGH